MLTDLFLVITGLVALFIGGEGLIRSTVRMSESFGVSKLVIGIVVLGFGTSAPELMVSIDAALKNVPDIVLGNVLGSNIANILLIVGIAALLFPIANWDHTATRSALFATAVTVLLFIVILSSNAIGTAIGLLFTILLVLYLLVTYLTERKNRTSPLFEHGIEEFQDIRFRPDWIAPALSLLSLLFLIFGAMSLVDGASAIARTFGVSDAVIGLSLVAIGTSLPELCTTIVAALRRHPDVVIGNVIGSNIFNILGILGITTILHPVTIAAPFRTFDMPCVLVTTCLLTGLLLIKKPIGRIWGVMMVIAYGFYMFSLFTRT